MDNEKLNGTELKEKLADTDLSQVSGGRGLDDIGWGPFGDAMATCHSCRERNIVYKKDYPHWNCSRCHTSIYIDDVD